MSVIVSNYNSDIGIRTAYAPGFQELLFKNNSLLPLFGKKASPGDTHYRWKGHITGNSSVEIFTEDQTMPTAGNQGYVNLAQAYLAFRFVTRVTDHARAALKSQWFPVLEQEQTLGNTDLVDLITTTFMGSTYGLTAQIDSTGDYGGVTRGSATYIESAETQISRDLQLTDLQDMVETLADNDRGAHPDTLLCSLNQRTNMARFAGPSGMFVYQGGSDPLPGFLKEGSILGMKLVGLPDWDDNTIVLMRSSDVSLIEHMPYTVFDQGRSGSSDVFMTEWMGLLLHESPKFAGKLTSVSS